jgi:hypothetical protein
MTDDATYTASLLAFVIEQTERVPAPPPPELPCAVCKREMRKRVDGHCRVVMDLVEVGLERCGLLRNGKNDRGEYVVPLDPHKWHGGFDHVRDERDTPFCACGHEYHEGDCEPCAKDLYQSENASHPYLAGILELDHEARE